MTGKNIIPSHCNYPNRTIVCPKCLEANDPEADNCAGCGYPTTAQQG